MGKLTFGDILKPFYQGDLQGKKRYLRITKKIKDKEAFQLVTGESVVLDYANSKAKRGFETGDLNTLAEAVAGSYKFPFKRVDVEDLDPNAKPDLYPISKLEKTSEFGGGSTGKVADPHELMTAALIIENGTSNTVIPKEKYNTLKKADEHITSLKSTAGSVRGPNKPKIISAFEGDYANYARAISAANGFLKAMDNGSKVKEVYLTGQKWDQEIAKYGYDSHELFGNKNYNTSDIVVRVETARGDRKIVGISLKKKNRKGSVDPTIINKTVTGENGLLKTLVANKDQHKLTKHLGKLYMARAQFFFNVIEAALLPPNPVTNGKLKTRRETMQSLGIDDAEKISEDFMKKYKGTTVAEKQSYQKRAQEMQEKQIKINIEEYLDKLEKKISTNFQTSKLVTKEIAKIGNQKAKDSLMGKFPSHTKVRNIYFATLNSIITLGDVSEMICEGLLNIIFKLDLRKYTDKVAAFKNESFHFTLITGVGMLAGDSTIAVDVASVYPEEITTSLLLKMISNRKTRTLEIRPRKGYIQPHKGGTSASLKYEIFVNNINIIDMEIRYKGEITPEPQFQAIITSKFAQMVKKSPLPDTRY